MCVCVAYVRACGHSRVCGALCLLRACVRSLVRVRRACGVRVCVCVCVRVLDQLVFMNIEIKLVGKIINIVFVIYCLSP